MWGAKPKAPKKDSKETESSLVSEFKTGVVNVSYDFTGTKFSGEGRTIIMELDNINIVACYVPNSGQNLERLDYRVDEWFVKHMRFNLITYSYLGTHT